MEWGRVTVATVSEDREPYRSETVDLFRSLRVLGGCVAGARAIAFFVKSVSLEAELALSKLDVQIRLVQPVDERLPLWNKLRMFQERPYGDYLIALDNDLAICGDFGDEVTGGSIAAKPVDGNPLSLEQWSALYQWCGLEMPPARFLTTFDRRETIPYFNSGVLLVPADLVVPLHQGWSSMLPRLYAAAAELSFLEPHGFFFEQFALALAIASQNFPFRPLPLEMNFPTHYAVHEAYRPDRIEPLIVHHHHRTTPEEGVLPTSYEGVNRMIAKFNAIRGDGRVLEAGA
jgi:hypothetical protein